MNELALFAGAGGGILGGRLLGWRTVCAVERNEYAASVLVQRQNDGHLEPFPIWCDVRTFDGRPWRGRVDVVSGGFPCQDISAAGSGKGVERGERSGLWSHMARIVGEVRPRYVFVENSPLLTTRGLGTVLGSLASLGYDAEWGVMGAHHVGAPHKRDRMWILGADSQRSRLEGLGGEAGQPQERQPRDMGSTVPDSSGVGHVPQAGQVQAGWDRSEYSRGWEVEPLVGRVADGLARRVDRLKAIGNGQVPQTAALAFRVLQERLEVTK